MRCNTGWRAATMNRVSPRLITFKPLLFLVAFIASFLGADGPSSSALPPVPATVESITPAELRMHLDFLASKELGGRYTLASNFAVSARYLAAHLKAYGFRGAGPEGDFLQFFDEKVDNHQQLLKEQYLFHLEKIHIVSYVCKVHYQIYHQFHLLQYIHLLLHIHFNTAFLENVLYKSIEFKIN